MTVLPSADADMIEILSSLMKRVQNSVFAKELFARISEISVS